MAIDFDVAHKHAFWCKRRDPSSAVCILRMEISKAAIEDIQSFARSHGKTRKAAVAGRGLTSLLLLLPPPPPLVHRPRPRYRLRARTTNAEPPATAVYGPIRVARHRAPPQQQVTHCPS